MFDSSHIPNSSLDLPNATPNDPSRAINPDQHFGLPVPQDGVNANSDRSLTIQHKWWRLRHPGWRSWWCGWQFSVVLLQFSESDLVRMCFLRLPSGYDVDITTDGSSSCTMWSTDDRPFAMVIELEKGWNFLIGGDSGPVSWQGHQATFRIASLISDPQISGKVIESNFSVEECRIHDCQCRSPKSKDGFVDLGWVCDE